MTLAIASLLLQGLGAFIAKLVVTPAGPSALLLAGGGAQVVVGLVLAPPWRWRREELSGRPALYTVIAYAIAGIATIGYLSALAMGPAALVVPLVAASPALARAARAGGLERKVGSTPADRPGGGAARCHAAGLSRLSASTQPSWLSLRGCGAAGSSASGREPRSYCSAVTRSPDRRRRRSFRSRCRSCRISEPALLS